MEGAGLLAILLGLLALSGFFSGAETALFSINALRMRELAGSESAGDRAIARAMKSPRNTLVTILVGNLVVNILASALASAFVIRASGSAGLGVLVTTIAMTFLILVLGEIAPKTVALAHREAIARAVAPALLVLGRLLTPVRWPLIRLTDAILGGEAHHTAHEIEVEEVEVMLERAHAEGELQTRERDLIRGVMELGSSPLSDVMTPRTEIVAIDPGLTAGEARSVARPSGYSKFPVSTEAPDEMVGWVSALDLLGAEDDARVGSLVRKAPYVPEVKGAFELLEEMRRSGDLLAFVIDEHGHLSGLVTLTDLLEEISGEMIEVGDLHKVLYETVEKGRFVVPGRMELRFFNEEFGTDLRSVEAETIAGLLLEHSGRIPSEGEEFFIEGTRIRVVKSEPNRIVTLEVVLPEPPSGEEF